MMYSVVDKILFSRRIGRVLLACVLLAAAEVSPSLSSAQGATWKLSPDPVLQIGEDGTPQTEFTRISGMTRTALGDIVVANSGSNEIRIFNAAGKFVKSFGRSGAGPGEFQSMSWIGRSGDTLFVFDFQSLRISAFTFSKGYISSRMMPPLIPDARLYPVARFSNGDYLVQPIRPTSMRHPDGTYRDSVRIGALLSASDSVSWIGTVPYMSYFAQNPNNAERAERVGSYRLGPQAQWAVWGNLVWVGDGSSNEVVLYDKTGKVSSKARMPWAERAFDKVALARTAKQLTADVPAAQREFVAAMWSPKYLPRVEPSFKQFLVSPEGHLWVERFHFDAATPGECVVMTRTGTVVATLAIPGNFELREVGSDYVLGIKRDNDGVESVAMYRIYK